MKAVRSGRDAEQAFEEAFGRRGEMAALEDVARRAANRGRVEEVDVCIERLRAAGTSNVGSLEVELRAILRAVRAHPSFASRRAS